MYIAKPPGAIKRICSLKQKMSSRGFAPLVSFPLSSVSGALFETSACGGLGGWRGLNAARGEGMLRAAVLRSSGGLTRERGLTPGPASPYG